jgi:two-component sensor histidine kinase/PAS domain-containing protein
MTPVRIIFAVGNEEERSAFSKIAKDAGFGEVYFPRDIADVEKLYSTDSAEAIVTDFSFHSGAFADWLTFWPLPAILLTDSGDDPERIERTIRDESSVFVRRDPEGAYLSLLPLLIRKVLNIRESLTRQNAHIQLTEHQYMNLLQAIPDIVYILDGNGCFMYLNDSIRSLGFEPAKLIGKHFSEIIHPADVAKVSRLEVLQSYDGVVTGPDGAPKLFDERRAGPRMTRNLELRLRHNMEGDDYHFASVNAYGEVSCAGWKLPEYENMDLGTVGIIRDITARKEYEKDLERALAAKEILLKEIHHRVKNNLQVVSSLLNLQENVVEDASARKVFLECQTQVQSMAMVHEVLYRSDNFEGVEMQKYFERLSEYLSGVYEGAYRGIRCSVSAKGLSLDLDSAIPVALIVNELVSNSFKHAFPDMRKGGISISLAEKEKQLELVVCDDGVGFEAAKGAKEPSSAQGGIGSELVQALTAQLHGEIERRSERGARTVIHFPKNV